jgi:DNA-directed RNA polymerase specialized sigma24 family protein
MNDLHQEWSAAPEPPDPFDNFKAGCPKAFRHFFRVHNYRIYCFLLRQTRERRRSRELTKNCFIALFRNYRIVKDQEHMLRVLYMLARMSLLLPLVDADAVAVLEEAWATAGPDDAEILEDPDVTRNETLLAIQQVIQQLSGAKRELAELYFFQGMTINAIAQFLGVDKAIVRERVSQMLRSLMDEPSGRSKNNPINNYSRSLPTIHC